MNFLSSIPDFVAEGMKLPFQKSSVFTKASYYTKMGLVWTYE